MSISEFKVENVSLEAMKMVFVIALSEVLPFAKPLASGQHSPLWFVDFYYKGSLDQQIIPMIEETMRKVVKSNLSIKSQEMLLSNAVEFWKYHGNLLKSEMARAEEDGVKNYLLIDKILEESTGDIPLSTEEAGVVQLLSLKSTGEEWVWRVWGSAFPEKNLSKDYKKIFNDFQKSKIIEPIRSEEGLLWDKKGSVALSKLLKYLHSECEKEKISYLYTPKGDKFKWHKELFEDAPSPSWRSYEVGETEVSIPDADLDDPFATPFPMRDWQFRFFREEKLLEELISSLQFIERTTTIFGLKGEWHLHADPKLFGSRGRFKKLFECMCEALNVCNVKAIETKTTESTAGISLKFMLVDLIGRSWPGSQIKLLEKPLVIESKGKERSEFEGITLSLFQSCERWISIIEN